MDIIFSVAKDSMERTIQALKKDLNSVTTGRANPNLLDTIRVEAYGNFVPLNQISNVSVPDASTISIQPWDKAMVNAVERAITNANLGFTPKVDGMIIRINVPKLTEERRKEFVKLVKKYGEDKKISIRNDRRDALDNAKKKKDGVSEDDIKRFENKVQTLTDDYIKKIDEMILVKENEIMKV
ncbi:MAG TPA: ribosome recycling factor [Rickettsiales bacterium]|nr:ribosome recycling factor [Rickettsiales bacterium]